MQFSLLPGSELHPLLERCQDAGLMFEIEFPKFAVSDNIENWRAVDRDITQAIEGTPIGELPPRTNAKGDVDEDAFPTHPSSTRWAIASAAQGRVNNQGDVFHRIRPLNCILSSLEFKYENILPFTIKNSLQKSSTQGSRIMIICRLSYMFFRVLLLTSLLLRPTLERRLPGLYQRPWNLQ
jgi:hypothetical protein